MKYLCIHGHFYQPPRENPWLEAIELQDSAYPYHDWNERITAECYAPNAATRILDHEGRILKIVNNYSLISFNFGPTLLAWVKDKAPGLHQMILEADQREPRNIFRSRLGDRAGYNHMIMPLANARDKYTQIYWGIEDFRFRFGRTPEGMWLPETAVDLESLDILAELGMKFTILSPASGATFRQIGEAELDGRQRRPHRPDARLQLRNALGKKHRDLLLRRADLAGGRVRRVAEQRRDVCRSSAECVFDSRMGPTGAYRHRWRNLRPSSSLRRNGAGLCAAPHRGERARQAHELRRVSGETSADARSGDLREQRLELRARRGSLERKLRLQLRRPRRMESGVARARCARLSTGCATTLRRCTKNACGQYLRDPWEARDDYICIILDRSPEVREAFLQRHANTRR